MGGGVENPGGQSLGGVRVGGVDMICKSGMGTGHIIKLIRDNLKCDTCYRMILDISYLSWINHPKASTIEAGLSSIRYF